MTRFMFSLLITLMTLTAYSQKDVTKFLGIPVDGSKAEMIQKLKAKGFKSTYYDKDILEGEFNGTNVYINVVTNGNKVHRIMVTDKTPQNKTNIKHRFNRLCTQFENNTNYTSITENQSISDDEDIDYNISVNKKRYEAVYYQTSRADMDKEIANICSAKYTQEQLANPTSAIAADCKNMITEYLLNIYSKKTVWFMISEDSYNKYKICMYYDNEYNQANGEDL